MSNKILTILDAGKKAFLTGSGGVGKSWLTKQVIKDYESRGKSVAVGASTGLAARGLHDAGRTIHSLLALGISVSISDFKASKYKFVKPKVPLVTLDLLVIDEVSMLSSDFFDLIMYRLEEGNFSGDILLVGDFLQLSPIENRMDEHGATLEIKYAFESRFFQSFKPLLLTENKRVVEGHDNFMMLLNRTRYGEFNHYDAQEIAKYQILDPDPTNKTVLVATNTEATTYNMQELQKIDSEPLHNVGEWTKVVNRPPSNNLAKLQETLLNSIIPPATFVYKIGCKVLITSNDLINGDYVNGDRGEIIEATEDVIVVRLQRNVNVVIKRKEYEITFTKNNTEYVICSFIQFPLVLASSITIHKSQGLSIELLDIDCSKIFTEAQFYVALSRTSNPDFLGILNFDPRLIRANPKAVQYYRTLEKENNGN